MKMFFTPIPKFCSSRYFCPAFLSNIGCFSAGPPVHGIIYIDLAGFTGFSTLLTGIIAALAAYMTACFMLCSAAILSCISHVWECLL